MKKPSRLLSGTSLFLLSNLVLSLIIIYEDVDININSFTFREWVHDVPTVSGNGDGLIGNRRPDSQASNLDAGADTAVSSLFDALTILNAQFVPGASLPPCPDRGFASCMPLGCDQHAWP